MLDWSHGFRLGSWTIRPDRGVLEGPGGAVHLEPKLMDLLLCLARRSGEVVSKDEIFQTVWPGQFVAEVGLKRNVSQIRRALGDDAREPRIIRTVPKRGYQLLVEPVPLVRDAVSAAPSLEDSRATRFATRPSIAVLPFADLSPDRDQEYFCDGIAEQIINSVSRVERLRVVSRTWAFAFKHKSVDVREIGRELGVGTLLEGSVRKAGSRLRINVQMIDVPDGSQLWSQQYDRELEDIFRIQEEIAQSIADALSVRLSERERRSIEKVPTRDVEAYDLYLRGRQLFYGSKRRSIGAARESFAQATEKDPGYALAWAGMADCHSYLFMYFGGSADDLELAHRSSATALLLDPELSEAHAARGLAHALSKRYVEAEQEFKSAIALNPKQYEAHYFYARICFVQGKFEKAAMLYQRASEIDPDEYQASSLLAFTCRVLKDPERAEAAHRHTLANVERRLKLDPDDSRALYLGATALLDLGRHDEGLLLVERSLAIDPEDPYIVYGGACFYARMGRLDDALRCFERAVETGFVQKEWIDRDADLDPLRGDERFRAAVRRLEPTD